MIAKFLQKVFSKEGSNEFTHIMEKLFSDDAASSFNDQISKLNAAFKDYPDFLNSVKDKLNSLKNNFGDNVPEGAIQSAANSVSVPTELSPDFMTKKFNSFFNEDGTIMDTPLLSGDNTDSLDLPDDDGSIIGDALEWLADLF